MRSPTAAADRRYGYLIPGYLRDDPRDADGGWPRRSTRDWVVDFACLFVAVVPGGLFYAAITSTTRPGFGIAALDLAFGIVGSVALWWRRKWPVQIALVLGLMSCCSSAVSFAALIALFTVAVHRSSRTVFWTGLGQLIPGFLYMVFRPDSNTTWLSSVVFTFMFVAVTIAWGMFVRARRQLMISLQDRAERAEAEQGLRVSQARQLERARIAREMHDVLAHRISLISLQAGALEFRAAAVGQDVADSAAVIRDSAHQALEDLREVIGVLRAGTDDSGGRGQDEPKPAERPQPTLADVPELVEESRRAGMKVALAYQVDDADTGIPLSVGRTAYRIVQEGLTNARKHAPGAAVTVSLTGDRTDGVHVRVLSRRPISAPTGSAAGSTGGSMVEAGLRSGIPGAGLGLVGLTERTGLAGGRLDHGRTTTGDFHLDAWLPWPAQS